MRNKIIAVWLGLNLLMTSNLFSQNMDIDLLKSINGNASDFKTNFFKAETQSVIVFNLAAPTATFLVGLKNHDAKLKEKGMYMLGSFLAAGGTAVVAKQIFKRNRPFLDYAFVVKRDDGGGYSLPSGHTSAAFATATSLSICFPKWYVIAPSYLWASTVAYARVYQGVHYPSDVLAGAVVGAGSAWVCYKIQKWMDRKRK